MGQVHRTPLFRLDFIQTALYFEIIVQAAERGKRLVLVVNFATMTRIL
jgi:hypothetical protein